MKYWPAKQKACLGAKILLGYERKDESPAQRPSSDLHLAGQESWVCLIQNRLGPWNCYSATGVIDPPTRSYTETITVSQRPTCGISTDGVLTSTPAAVVEAEE